MMKEDRQVTSSAGRLSSWITVVTNTIVDIVKDASKFIRSSLSFISRDTLPVEAASGNASQRCDVNSTIMSQ